ncbi:MAG TPA: hypothetical protein VJ043_03780 [Candidatus Paceibacterota bacterium]|nr:hypothetical protein [Candidatus Paceibacterota bacterium]
MKTKAERNNLDSVFGGPRLISNGVKKILRYLRERAQNVLFAAFAPLADIPPQSEKLSALYNTDANLATYINSMFKIAISVGAIIAVIRLGIAGFKYMGGDMWHTKEKAKEDIRDVFFGLLLLLSIWIILNQINPNLLNLNVVFPKTPEISAPKPQPVEPITKAGGIMPDGSRGSCAGCVNLPPGVAAKTSACGRSQCYISLTLAEKMTTLRVKAVGMSWYVSEAWPPTVIHSSICHNNGTCFDANLVTKNSSSPQEINQFVNAARASGLIAKWEVGSEARKQELIKAGVDSSFILVPSYPPSVEHFHITGN